MGRKKKPRGGRLLVDLAVVDQGCLGFRLWLDQTVSAAVCSAMLCTHLAACMDRAAATHFPVPENEYDKS